METKVVHFRMNPAALSQQHRALELSKLKEENERLRERVKLLQDAASAGAASHAVDDLTAKVEENLLQPSTSKETEGKLKFSFNKTAIFAGILPEKTVHLSGPRFQMKQRRGHLSVPFVTSQTNQSQSLFPTKRLCLKSCQQTVSSLF